MYLANFNKKFLIKCFTLLFILGCVDSKDNEKPADEIEKKVENKDNNIEMSYSVNLNIQKFPKNYSFLDKNIFFDVLNNIVARPFSKGEFETTEEFKTKIKNLDYQMHQTPIIANLTIDSLFTIDLENANILFDADNSKMNINIYLGGDNLWSSYGISDSKEAHIRYSESSEISLYDKHSPPYKSILVTNHTKFSDKRELITKLSMDREYARKEKENIKVVATIKLVKPWYWHRFSDISRADRKYIFLEVIQFWIINAKTGEIYKMIVPEK